METSSRALLKISHNYYIFAVSVENCSGFLFLLFPKAGSSPIGWIVKLIFDSRCERKRDQSISIFQWKRNEYWICRFRWNIDMQIWNTIEDERCLNIWLSTATFVFVNKWMQTKNFIVLFKRFFVVLCGSLSSLLKSLSGKHWYAL